LGCHALANVNPETLSDPEAAAYLWVVNRFICERLSSGNYRSRLLVFDGNRVADSPEKVLPRIAAICELTLDEKQLGAILDHPSARKYSKDLSKAYDINSRRREIEELEKRFGAEADSGIQWAESCDIPMDLPGSP
jgi:hypothetical protein